MQFIELCLSIVHYVQYAMYSGDWLNDWLTHIWGAL